jgi:phosphoribosylanthranilate isomerase
VSVGARIKVCGVTSVEQARWIADLGVESIGVNFVPGSPRRTDETTARAIVDAVGDRTLVVAVVAGLPLEELRGLRERTGVGCLQLHGDEPDATLEALLPHAYRAVRVGSAADVKEAARAPGEYVMVDAKVAGALGGTGHSFDWTLVIELARTRKVLLAGGLRPENVARAVATVNPFCVDVASGVESAPGIKDPERVRRFIEAVRSTPASP